MTISALY